jgi:hypothetical protein
MASIAKLDKRALDLEHLASLKKTQLTTEYANLQKNAKENPYLHLAIAEYKILFDKEKEQGREQIKALMTLLKGIDKKNVADRNEIKREIKRIEDNM